MSRQQNRNAARKVDSTREALIKKMHKPATKLELFAMGQDIDHKLTVIDKFLTEKYGEEFENFVKKEIEDKFAEEGYIPETVGDPAKPQLNED